MKSLRSYFHSNMLKQKEISTADHLVVSEEEESLELERCIKKNEEWNAKIAIEREARLAREAEEQRNIILERLDQAEERRRKAREAIEAAVREAKSKPIIRREDLESAIETAIANPISYNFAIDLQGNIIKGEDELTREAPKQSEAINQV